jgi:hypothetical protein
MLVNERLNHCLMCHLVPWALKHRLVAYSCFIVEWLSRNVHHASCCAPTRTRSHTNLVSPRQGNNQALFSTNHIFWIQWRSPSTIHERRIASGERCSTCVQPCLYIREPRVYRRGDPPLSCVSQTTFHQRLPSQYIHECVGNASRNALRRLWRHRSTPKSTFP